MDIFARIHGLRSDDMVASLKSVVMLPLSPCSASVRFQRLCFVKSFSLPSVEARHPCQTSELAHSAIEAMRPISMAQNDLLHGLPQSVHDNHLHVFPLALTFVLRIEYGVLLFNSAFMSYQWFEALCSILQQAPTSRENPKWRLRQANPPRVLPGHRSIFQESPPAPHPHLRVCLSAAGASKLAPG
ncbi:hypothetical protein GGI35DRAFT_83153 [Trichoderma velutinum]